MSGRGDELIDLARINPWRQQAFSESLRGPRKYAFTRFYRIY
jgi:hypothetical protein